MKFCNQLHDQLWDQLQDHQFMGQLLDQLRGQLPNQLGDQLWFQIQNQLRNQLRNQLKARRCPANVERIKVYFSNWNDRRKKRAAAVKQLLNSGGPLITLINKLKEFE